ncbi:Cilia- and flagella-associated protein 61 [Pleodorina starrii]|uniref:Cilia- and flagella-associated protein 61 n=1 Tax=Pleodorina starrii TaxID=330485 RepID=A0A9W6F019_9CHLO|nr:Cilia- and flagella-associated protein 61 [Pleodorina starrii]GLC51357.1 Cilia- and flagella-associated protein 61 [Pleodorina starrii]GLC63722.1 Cilia- and flagella-associated protein 61 [Pleodorina starrii]
MGISARLTVSRDVVAIDALVKKVSNVDPNSTLLLGSALLNLSALDEKDNLVGYLCLDDVPCARLGHAGGPAEVWTQEAAGPRFKLGSTAFVRVCTTDPLYEIEAASALLRAAFLLIPSLQTLLMTAGGELSFTEPGLASVFSRVASSKEAGGAVLYEAPREAVVPPLTIRPARVEDHDDMLPILQRCERAFPALAKLPESSRPEEPFALTRVVAGQDDRNRVLVAEAEGRLVGFIVMTSDVDTGNLAETFDLHPYDNFLPPEVYEQQYEEARGAVRERKLTALRAEAARRRQEEEEEREVEAAEAEGGEGEGEQAAATLPSPSAAAAAAAAAAARGSGDGARASVEGEAAGGEQGEGGEEGDAAGAAEPLQISPEEAAMLAEAEPTDEETRGEMLALFAGTPLEVEPTLFAVTMLCMDPAFEAQAHEFLGSAFAAFHDKLYCVVTLPHDSHEPALMETMTRIAPLPGSLFPEVLFMFHRHALLPDFCVRLGSPEDLEQVATLVSGMPNAPDICASFTGAAAAGTAAVALCQGEVVGLCTVNPEVDLELLQANFALASHVDLAYQPRPQHGEIDMYTMNPIFVHRHRPFLAAAMRLLGKTALYYALPPGQQPPDMQEVLAQVAPRHRTAFDKQLQAEFALYAFTRAGAFKRRRSVNAQIVIAGASECGLAVLERLLLDTELQFNYLTLLAPGGIKVGGMVCQYTAGVIARLGLEARVLLLDAEMTGLEREPRVVHLSDNSALSYNQLVITAGLQDQSRYRFADADPEVAGLLVTELELAADFSMNDALVMNDIVVYGGGLGAYHALSVLEAKSAIEKTRFLAPPGQAAAAPLVGVLSHMALELGLALPLPEPLELASLAIVKPVGPELHATAVVVDPAEPGAAPQEAPCDLVVGCEPPSVSRALFACLNDASLVFDGRLVVDSAFRTNDPHIYAGGTIAKLSRRYGGAHLEHYNSRDVGTKLAASLVACFTASAEKASESGDAATAAAAALPPPPAQLTGLHRARAVGCSLPGGHHFMFAGCPAALAAPGVAPPPGGSELVTTTDRGQTRLTLDDGGVVHALMYLGRVPVSAQRMGCLVGLHSSYLNQVVRRHAAGEVRDLLAFLTEPWAELLYNESFGGLREVLLETGLASVSMGDKAGGDGGLVQWVTSVQDTLLEFARAHASELPGYNVPSAART